ncbi:MAG: hypothetical protein JRI25_10800 [Deltaproteobacteria bacterium]|nr:hypothetical protein [Deltaproteobacteria bacterium]
MYRSVVRRTSARMDTSRAEEWSYLVRDLDIDGVATLEGRLTGFGAGASMDGTPVPEEHMGAWQADEQERLASPVTLRLGLDGHLVACSVTTFSDSLPHRMLGLRIPPVRILPHDEWPIPGLANPFADLLPPEMEVDVACTARLVELHHHDARIAAEIETTGALRVRGGPAVHLSGMASWDAERGVLAHRELQARLTPSTPDPLQNPGILNIELHLV